MLQKFDERIEKIRIAEEKSHIKIYNNIELYEKGTWLQKPIKTVMELLPLFKEYKELNVLDLGCGIGRNCIPIAQTYSNIDCYIDCIDILDLAIKKLINNAEKYNVGSIINGINSTIEDFIIPKNKYDLVLGISALEHINNKNTFIEKLNEIKDAIKDNGIVCLIINSNVFESLKSTGESIEPQFELNFDTDELLGILDNIFFDWKQLKVKINKQQYDIPRELGLSLLMSNVVTFVARKQ